MYVLRYVINMVMHVKRKEKREEKSETWDRNSIPQKSKLRSASAFAAKVNQRCEQVQEQLEPKCER
ncbi:hypothetical protein XENTR_v10019273 [Xenopus tropicalis]|nr:hypothetical protein XENTR_v10019273 [Xenopus tropicalis]KAE8593697.1 hypothetical protein XENTR_v10019273 [Xenopus tropicalis]